MRSVTKGTFVIAAVVLFSLYAMSLTVRSATQEVPRITKEDLKAMLGKPGIILLDVRLQDQWETSDQKITGAVHENPGKDVNLWLKKYPKNKTIIFY